MKQVLKMGWVLILSMGIMLVACGPAGTPETGGDDGGTVAENVVQSIEADADSGGGDVDGNVEAEAETEAVANVAGIEIDPESIEVDESGIQVGFTKSGHPFRGNPQAPVVIEEYSDYQCPYCSRFFEQTLPAIDTNYIAEDDVFFIYKDFPLESIHPQARMAAVAARCVGEYGGATAYWEMHDILFARMRDWSNAGVRDMLVSYAGEIGVDEGVVGSCIDEGRYNQEVSQDLQAGSALGVRGTPAFFINGSLLSGAQPIGAFDVAISRAKEGQPAVAAAPPATNNSTAGSTVQQPIVVPTPVPVTDDYAAAIGDPNAPVTIVEYTDYQCPFCARHSAETYPSILSDMIETGRVYYMLKDLPLDNIHPQARTAAVAARCAGEQEAYWEMHDELFARQGEWAGKNSEELNEVLGKLATDIELDEASFDACLVSGKYDQAVQDNVREAQQLGVSSTPSFFVDGYPLNGARPYSNFVTIVDLAEKDQLADAFAEALRQRQEQIAQEQAQEAQQQAQQPTGPVNVPINGEPALGDPNAPVTIVEYTDYQCPFCQRHSAQTLPTLLKEYVETGQVYYVVKDFPLESIHPQAFLASEAARCAYDQGADAFLGLHDKMFENQQAWSNNNAATIFVGYAAELGLDTETFQSCLESRKYQQEVRDSLNEGIGFGVRGTPSFFINGQFISGAQPLATFETIINGQVTR
ncbi:MAG TPA: thioredoxin domain-containing protein [Anaerolineae bacterium]|nr:thioredoxin domain-containing protein [Anaerolineae bacterium]